MKNLPAYCRNRQNMRTGTINFRTAAFLIPLLTTSFVNTQNANLPQEKNNKQAVLSISYFIESANNTVNSLNSLLKKDNYRNKITTLNNPVNNELGFSLKNEILVALKPILDKVKKN